MSTAHTHPRHLVRTSHPPSWLALKSNPHRVPLPERCTTSRDFVPWRFFDAST
jgi:hypothetical protein